MNTKSIITKDEILQMNARTGKNYTPSPPTPKKEFVPDPKYIQTQKDGAVKIAKQLFTWESTDEVWFPYRFKGITITTDLLEEYGIYLGDKFDFAFIKYRKERFTLDQGDNIVFEGEWGDIDDEITWVYGYKR